MVVDKRILNSIFLMIFFSLIGTIMYTAYNDVEYGSGFKYSPIVGIDEGRKVTCNSCEDCTEKAKGGNVYLELEGDINVPEGVNRCIDLDSFSLSANNTVLNCDGYKITSSIEGPNLVDGIYIGGQDRIHVNKCTFENLANGINMRRSSNIVISENKFFRNRLIGVFISHSEDIDLVGNVMSYNGKAVDMSYMKGVILKDNRIFSNEIMGVDISKGTFEMDNNIIVSNGGYGISLFSYGEPPLDGNITNTIVCNNGYHDIEDTLVELENTYCDLDHPYCLPCNDVDLNFCEDSDVLRNWQQFYDEYEFVGNIYLGEEYKVSDICMDEATLIDYFCSSLFNYDSRIITGVDGSCHEGGFHQETCYDSDDFSAYDGPSGDINYYYPGSVYVDGAKYSDECIDEDNLKEYFCSGDSLEFSIKNCSCSEGGCSEPGVMFYTSRTWKGNFGGIEGADAWCQEIAGRADLSGIWKAVISGSSKSILDRFNNWFSSDQMFVNMGSDVIANSVSDLFDGELINPVLYREKGKTPIELSDSYSPWTGSTPLGESSQNTCNDWTINPGKRLNGIMGDYDKTSSRWIEWTYSSCLRNKESLYCVRIPS